MVRTQHLRTKRLDVAFRQSGSVNAKRLLFLHGNLSSSVYILPLFPYLEKDFCVVAPDLRCFGETEALGIDATRGYRDWSDDIYSFIQALGWDDGKDFMLCGWSMGGNIAMQFCIDHPGLVEKLVLLCPGSPYGFGGTKDAEGTPFLPMGLGSGAGTANPALTFALEHQSRFLLRDVLTKYYFNPPFRMPRIWENRLLDALGTTALGVEHFPGNFETAHEWPYVCAGNTGVLNAMSSAYGRLDDFLTLKKKPSVLWIRGENDNIVSDESLMDLGYLGKLGMAPGWPGEDVYPPQPMLSQLRLFFARYQTFGGKLSERVLEGGHMCALENPDAFAQALISFAE